MTFKEVEQKLHDELYKYPDAKKFHADLIASLRSRGARLGQALEVLDFALINVDRLNNWKKVFLIVKTLSGILAA